MQINGSEGRLLGEELRKELVSRGVRVGKIAVLNDTPATLLGGMSLVKSSKYGGFIGMVAGTGFNACCMLPQDRIAKAGFAGGRKMLVNLEAGSFDGFPRSAHFREAKQILLWTRISPTPEHTLPKK